MQVETEEKTMGEVDVLRQGWGKNLELKPALLRSTLVRARRFLLPAVRNDEYVFSQPDGGALGELVGDVEAKVCHPNKAFLYQVMSYI
jgi:hypothetical protein